MKRKIALLLSVVMLLGVSIPANLFAASNLTLDTVYSTYNKYALSFAPGQATTGAVLNAGVVPAGPYDGATVNEKVVNNGRGSNLMLTFNGITNYNETQSFFINLTNARWGFINSSSNLLANGNATSNYDRTWLKEISSGTATTGNFAASNATGWINRLRVDNMSTTTGTQGGDDLLVAADPANIIGLVNDAVGAAINAVAAELDKPAGTNVTFTLLETLGTDTLTAYINGANGWRNGVANATADAERAALVAIATNRWTTGFASVMTGLGVAAADNWTGLTTPAFVSPYIIGAAAVPTPADGVTLTAPMIEALNSTNTILGLGLAPITNTWIDYEFLAANLGDPVVADLINRINTIKAAAITLTTTGLRANNAAIIKAAVAGTNYAINTNTVFGHVLTLGTLLNARAAAAILPTPLDLFYSPDVPGANVDSPYQTMVRNLLGITNPVTDVRKGIEYTIDINSTYTQAMITVPGGQAIRNGDVLVLPLCVRSNSTDEMSLSVDGSGSIVSSVSNYVFGIGGASAGTNITTTPVKSARGRIYLNGITFSERAIGQLQSGSFRMDAPAGYEWITTGATITSNQAINYPTGITSGNWAGFASFALNSTNTQLTVTLNNNFPSSTTAPGTMTINGLIIVPVTNDTLTITNYGNLNVSIYNSGAGVSERSTNVSEGRLLVATRSDWQIGYSADDPALIYSGRRGTPKNWSAEVVIEEYVFDSWNTMKETIFTLTDADGNALEDVKFTSAYVDTSAYLRDAAGDPLDSEEENGEFLNVDNAGLTKGLTPMPYKNGSFNRQGNSFTLTDLRNAATATTQRLSSATLNFMLTAQPNFEGDVYLKVSGNALSDNYYYDEVENDGIVHIATFIAPVYAEAKTSNVDIGFQSYKVDTVVVTENFDSSLGAGLIAGRKLQLAIGEYGTGRLSNYMYFAPITKDDYTVEGDKMFNLTSPTFNSTIVGANVAYGYGRVVEFTVARASTTAGAVITLTNLQVNIDKTVPEGQYDFLIGGDALVQNFQTEYGASYNYDKFDIFGVIVKDYINVVTPGANKQFKQTVEVWAGSDIAIVDGVEFQMEVPVLNVDGRLFIPIRFVAVALGVDDNDIRFDEISRKVIIMTTEKTVTFQQDSSVYTINGTEMNMSENGVVSKMFIDEKTGRSYIPFRYLAYAFSIPVDYDDATGVATYNPK